MRITPVALAALSVVASSCVIAPVNRSGDITFEWTFDGSTCSHTADVASVQIHIPGEVLMNDGNFSCNTAGTDGIVLNSFLGGTYDFTIDGLDSAGNILYTASGSFIVDGSIVVTVDLAPVHHAGGTAILQWTFPATTTSNDPTCADVGVTHVDVTIDGAAAVRYVCADGQGVNGVATDTLTSGSHTISFSAVDANDIEYYGGVSTVVPSTVAQVYDLAWTVGGVALKWTLVDTSVVESCNQSGVTMVFANFRDSSNHFVYTGTGVSAPCGDGAVGEEYDFLAPGTYDVFLQASAPGNALFQSDQAVPVQIHISAGVFGDSASAPNITMDRTQ